MDVWKAKHTTPHSSTTGSCNSVFQQDRENSGKNEQIQPEAAGTVASWQQRFKGMIHPWATLPNNAAMPQMWSNCLKFESSSAPNCTMNNLSVQNHVTVQGMSRERGGREYPWTALYLWAFAMGRRQLESQIGTRLWGVCSKQQGCSQATKRGLSVEGKQDRKGQENFNTGGFKRKCQIAGK